MDERFCLDHFPFHFMHRENPEVVFHKRKDHFQLYIIGFTQGYRVIWFMFAFFHPILEWMIHSHGFVSDAQFPFSGMFHFPFLDMI